MLLTSIYDSNKHSENGTLFDIYTFFNQIKDGRYKKEIEHIRTLKFNLKLEEQRCEMFSEENKKIDTKYQKAKFLLKTAKDNIPRITISGQFGKTREKENLTKHSGLINIDIDRIETEEELLELKQKLSNDKYCFACFITCGGDGLCWIVRIDPSKHEESWEGIKEYLANNYGVNDIDPVQKAVNATRNTSYDPDIFVYEDKLPPIFKSPTKKKSAPKKITNYIYVKDDFERAIDEIVSRRIDFCPSNDYELYRNIGFSIGNKCGILGLQYFDSICQFAIKYSEKQVHRDYKYFCKNPDKGITYGTFVKECQKYGIEVYSKKTDRIARVSSAMMIGGKTKETTIENLVKFEGFTAIECKDIVDQIFDNKIEFTDSENITQVIEDFILNNYQLIKNEITGKVECEGIEWKKEQLNRLYTDVKKAIPNSDVAWMKIILGSDIVKSYNPFKKFIEDNINLLPDELLDKHEIPTVIKDLANSIKTENPEFTLKYLTKWLVGIISSWHGVISPLELGLCGKLHKGKSFFFENLLPKELQKYFAEDTLDKEKDSEILMTEKAIILNNEGVGKSRADEKKHKRLLDKNYFSLRRPFGEQNEDIKRLAVLCFTSNPMNVDTDVHGNRRRIIIECISRDYKAYDRIDKAELFMAAYYLWKQDYPWRITENEIPELKANTTKFRDYSVEYELIFKYFEKSEDEFDLLTSTEIKMYLESMSQQKLRKDVITNELTMMGFFQRNNGETLMYRATKKTIQRISTEVPFP